MLSEQEKKELLEMAASGTLREEFRQLRRLSGFVDSARDLDELLRFLTAFSRFVGFLLRKPVPKPYRVIKI